MIQIVEIGDIAWQGKTEPVFCRCDNGLDYIVKGSFAGARALIAEWVANRLGKLLNLPIPDFQQLKLPTVFFDYAAKPQELQRLGKGTLFGSQRVPDLVELRASDMPRIDENLQARVLAFDWWIANSDRVFIDGAGNPNLLWDEVSQRLVVIDHNLAFEPSLMADFWKEHAFREARRMWSESFIGQISADFRAALGELPVIWQELPEDWLEMDVGLSFADISALLWKFDSEADTFWSRS